MGEGARYFLTFSAQPSRQEVVDLNIRPTLIIITMNLPTLIASIGTVSLLLLWYLLRNKFGQRIDAQKAQITGQAITMATGEANASDEGRSDLHKERPHETWAPAQGENRMLSEIGLPTTIQNFES